MCWRASSCRPSRKKRSPCRRATACTSAVRARTAGKTGLSGQAKVLWTGTMAILRPRNTKRRRPGSVAKSAEADTVKKSERSKSRGRTKTMKLFRTAMLAAVLALPLAPLDAFAATPPDVLVVAQNIDDIVAIDPAQAYEFTSGEFVTNVYDRLVQYDAEDTEKLAPGLATEWSADAAAKTITFTLRDGVKFHSGKPGAPGRRVLFPEAHGRPQQGAGLHPHATRLDARKHRRDGEDRRQQDRHQIRRRLLAELRAERDGLAPGFRGRRTDCHGQREGRRPRQCLAERQFRRLRAVQAARLPAGGDTDRSTPTPTISRVRRR